MQGVISRGIRAPIIKAGDDIVKIVIDSVLKAQEEESFKLENRDIIAVTESIVARADNNYCSVDDIAQDIHEKFGDEVGVIFPIMSRNRFAICLRGIARGVKKVIVQFSYPADEVGNHLVSESKLIDLDIDPYRNTFTEEGFREIFKSPIHPFTGVDYIQYYRSIIEEEGAEARFIFSNDPLDMLLETQNILCASIHNREEIRKKFSVTNFEKFYTLCDIMCKPRNGSGYSEYGLLGSNKATEETVKLFPKNAQKIVEEVQLAYLKATGTKVEVMIYGDGAFKDPVGKIWELADPVVAPGYTDGLVGQPGELKIKYLADNKYGDLTGDELTEAIKSSIKDKEKSLIGQMKSEGTTPRRYIDLIGSLCDLTSGSGDRGTPIVVVQNYFKNYSD